MVDHSIHRTCNAYLYCPYLGEDTVTTGNRTVAIASVPLPG